MLRHRGARAAMFVASVPTWLQGNDWANGQASPTQQVVTEQAAANAALASAQSNYYQGIADLAATAALRRLLAEGKPEPAALRALIGPAGLILDKVA
jgi:hypothetical protein